MATKVPNQYRRWTESAIECCNRQCICENCIMNELLKGRCKMKDAVINLVKYHGISKKIKQPTLKEDLYLTISNLSKHFPDVSISKLRVIIQRSEFAPFRIDNYPLRLLWTKKTNKMIKYFLDKKELKYHKKEIK